MKFYIKKSSIAVLLVCCWYAGISQTTQMNYIKADEIIDAKITDLSQIAGLATSKKRTSITYFDGLGRPVQELVMNKSPLGKHIVQHIEYDDFGRTPKNYLPFTHTGNGANFIGQAAQAQANFYTSPPTGVAATAYAYSETVFEPSPLNRPVLEAAPGEAWALEDGDKPVQTEYGTNTNGEVRMLKVDAVGDIYNHNNHYPAGSLYKNTVMDENKNTSITFTDLQGRQVLSRRFNKNHQGELELIDTYYVYNDLGLLVWVVMPEADLDAATFTDYGHTFGYVYDARKRMVEKHLPGAEAVYYVYDKLDRLRFEQDGNMRKHRFWKSVKYDALNRIALEGVYQPSTPLTREQLQIELNQSNAANFEEPANNDFGYTMHESFPHNSLTIITSYYYDNYDFKRNGVSQFNVFFISSGGFSDPAMQTAKGQPTAMRTISDLERNKLFEVYFYDNKYRQVQTVVQNLNKETSWHTGHKYNFGGVLLETNKKMKDSKGNELINYTFAYDYDHDWRLMQNSLIMNDNETVLSRHSYTETGMLRDKLLHPQGSQALYRLRHDYNVRGWLTGINNPADGHPDRYFGMRLYYESPPQHAIPHAKGQFNGNISAMQWFTKEAEASTNTNGYAYAYDGLNRLTNAVFYRFKDGSVSYVLPEHASNKQQNYGLVTGIGSVNEIRYDKNGNILSLKRLARQNDEVILFDDLTYFYNDNRLIAVDDVQQGQNTLGDFHDNGLVYIIHGEDEYYYDANGNMVGDMNRNMKLKYGLFHNMPIFISFEQVGGGGGGGLVEAEPIDASGKTATTTSYSGDIVNHYTYQGRKLAKKVYNSQHTLTVDEEYYDELMFSFGKPSRISHGDGYIALSDNGGATFYYYLKDHLGNVRSVILPDANNQPIVSQANDYFPFGMSFESTLPNPGIRANYNKLKYNSKEEQEMPGKWLDYGFRFYDSQIARFHSVDPLATKNHRQTPYAYAMNNPLRYIDWLGLDTLSVNSTQPVKKDDVVITENGLITANSDEVEVAGKSPKAKGGLHLTTNKDAGTNNDSREGDGSSVNIDGILPSSVGGKGGNRFLEFIRDAINIFSGISSTDNTSESNSDNKKEKVSIEAEINNNDTQPKVDSSRKVVIYYEVSGYMRTRGSGAQITTLRDSAKVAKRISERNNTKLINPE